MQASVQDTGTLYNRTSDLLKEEKYVQFQLKGWENEGHADATLTCDIS